MGSTTESRPQPAAHGTEGVMSTVTASDDRMDATASPLEPAFAAFARVTSTLETASSVDDGLRVIALEVARLVGVQRCSIQLREPDGELFRGRVGHIGGRSIDEEVRRSTAGTPADGLTGEVLRTRRPVIVSNAPADARMLQGTVRYWDIRSMMSVPMLSAGRVIGIIRLDEPGCMYAFTPADADLASVFAHLAAVAVTHAESKMELTATAEVARRQADALRRAAVVEDRLSALVLEGAHVQAIAAEFARLVGKPCAVYDAEHTRLAAAAPDACADGILPRLLEEPARSTSAVREAFAAGSEMPADGRRAAPFVVGPLPDAGVLHRYLVAPICAQGEVRGHLVVMEHKRRISGVDMLTVRRASTTLALHLTVEQRAAQADWDAGASLTAELLTMGTDQSAARRRAERLGVRLEAPRVVAFVGLRSDRSSAGDFRSLLAAFAAVAPGVRVHAAAATGGVAAIVDVEHGGGDDARRATVREIVRRLGPDMVAGLSSVCSNGQGYAAAYAEAREVVECIRRFTPAGGPEVFSSAELGPSRVLLATSDPDAMRRFAEGTLGGLAADPTKRDLLATLGLFFDNTASIRRCAERLGVHENTIRYRLSRLEELTGLLVTHDPDAQLRARLSVLVLALEGRLPAHDLPDRSSLPPSAAALRNSRLQRGRHDGARVPPLVTAV